MVGQIIKETKGAYKDTYALAMLKKELNLP
jgi:hypothetical protein